MKRLLSIALLILIYPFALIFSKRVREASTRDVGSGGWF